MANSLAANGAVFLSIGFNGDAILQIKMAMKTYIILLLLICTTAFSAEFEFKECMKVQIDLEALNALNKQALEIFPYSLNESSDPRIQTVTAEEMAEKYLLLDKQKTPEKYAQYLKLIEGAHVFSVSGGVTIKSIEKEARNSKGYVRCGSHLIVSKYSSKYVKYLELIRQIPHINPLLERAFARALIDSIHAYQDKMFSTKSKSSAAYFWIFGARSWGDRNIRQSQEYGQIMECVIDVANESMQMVEHCEEIKKLEQYKAYRKFLSAAVVNYVLTMNYLNLPASQNRYGFYGNIFAEVNEVAEKLSPTLGGVAWSLADELYTYLSDHYDKVMREKKVDPLK